MKHYDNNFDLFDAYLTDKMGDDDKRAFEKRLDNEPQLKQEFKEFKQLIFLIQQSGDQANQEFDQAMRNISDEDFKNIVSSKKEVSAPEYSAHAEVDAKPKGRVISLKKAYRWMSIAAMVVVVASVGMNLMMRSNFNQQLAQTNDKLKQLQQSNNDMKLAFCSEITSGHTPLEDLSGEIRGTDNDVVQEKYQTAIKVKDLSGKIRGTDNDVVQEKHQTAIKVKELSGKIRVTDNDVVQEKYQTAIKNLKEDKTDEAISTLEEIYKLSDDDRKAEIGYELAFAYVKAGDFDNAKRVIKEVKEGSGKLPQTFLDDLDKLEQKISKPYF